jgi:hypothetical protein
MSDTHEGAEAGPASSEPDEVDAGLPLAELAALRESPDPSFLDRVRTGIHRRFAASDTVDFALAVFFRTALSYLLIVLEALVASTKPRGDERRERS